MDSRGLSVETWPVLACTPRRRRPRVSTGCRYGGSVWLLAGVLQPAAIGAGILCPLQVCNRAADWQRCNPRLTSFALNRELAHKRLSGTPAKVALRKADILETMCVQMAGHFPVGKDTKSAAARQALLGSQGGAVVQVGQLQGVVWALTRNTDGLRATPASRSLAVAQVFMHQCLGAVRGRHSRCQRHQYDATAAGRAAVCSYYGDGLVTAGVAAGAVYHRRTVRGCDGVVCLGVATRQLDAMGGGSRLQPTSADHSVHRLGGVPFHDTVCAARTW